MSSTPELSAVRQVRLRVARTSVHVHCCSSCQHKNRECMSWKVHSLPHCLQYAMLTAVRPCPCCISCLHCNVRCPHTSAGAVHEQTGSQVSGTGASARRPHNMRPSLTAQPQPRALPQPALARAAPTPRQAQDPARPARGRTLCQTLATTPGPARAPSAAAMPRQAPAPAAAPALGRPQAQTIGSAGLPARAGLRRRVQRLAGSQGQAPVRPPAAGRALAKCLPRRCRRRRCLQHLPAVSHRLVGAGRCSAWSRVAMPCLRVITLAEEGVQPYSVRAQLQTAELRCSIVTFGYSCRQSVPCTLARSFAEGHIGT